MKLEYVLTSCNLNPLYCDFIPIFIKAWKKLIPEIKIVIVLVADDIPEKFLDYSEHIKIFKPIENVSDAFISQYIRILYPCILNSKNGILITDMDMIPLNSDFYLKNINDYDNDKFIYYRGDLELKKEYAICYNVALSKTWKDIFNIENEEDIIIKLKEIFSSFKYINGHGNLGWNKDQLDLYNYINRWNKKHENFIILKSYKSIYRRLCRSQFPGLNKKLEYFISQGKFSDYHALRPYERYKNINDKIIDLIQI